MSPPIEMRGDGLREGKQFRGLDVSRAAIRQRRRDGRSHVGHRGPEWDTDDQSGPQRSDIARGPKELALWWIGMWLREMLLGKVWF